MLDYTVLCYWVFSK